MTTIKRPSIGLIPLAQLAVLVPISLLVVLFFETKTALAYSFVLGGVIHILPNAYFAHYAFRYRGASLVSRIAQSFFTGEIGKFVLTLLGFSLLFLLVKPLSISAVFVGYLLMLAVHLVAAIKVVSV